MTNPDRPLPDDVEIDEEPTLSWEPGSESTSSDTGATRVEGAFAWALTIEGGPQAGLTYVLAKGDSIAGRGAASSVYLPDVTVSREHARLRVTDDKLTITDLASTNGTYINGVRHAAGTLSVDDLLMIGKFRLRVSKGHG
ncbi:MAG: FHA domain-containing protein [Actinomycetota bacterium]